MNQIPAPVSNVTINPTGKIRNPWMIILLSFVTLGIYPIVWYYSLFEELKNQRGQGWSGTLFLILFFLFPFALVALPWLIPAYIGRMYEEDGQAKPITGLAGFWQFLPLLGIFIWIFKVQNNLNLFWAQKSLQSSHRLVPNISGEVQGEYLPQNEPVEIGIPVPNQDDVKTLKPTEDTAWPTVVPDRNSGRMFPVKVETAGLVFVLQLNEDPVSLGRHGSDIPSKLGEVFRRDTSISGKHCDIWYKALTRELYILNHSESGTLVDGELLGPGEKGKLEFVDPIELTLGQTAILLKRG